MCIQTQKSKGTAFTQAERKRTHPLDVNFKGTSSPKPANRQPPQPTQGLAFTQAERERLYLRGLLPAATVGQGVQAERILMNMQARLPGSGTRLCAHTDAGLIRHAGASEGQQHLP